MSGKAARNQGASVPAGEEAHRREQPSNVCGRALFALFTLSYLGLEGYHLVYNIQVVNQRREDQFFNQEKLPKYAAYFIFSLIPALIVAIYGLTTTMFKDQDKVLRKAAVFRLISHLYTGLIFWGLYKIWADWHYEHHHNWRMMSYMFYLDFALQWGPAFIYSAVFRFYAQQSKSLSHKAKHD